MEYKINNVQQRDSFETQYGEMQAYAIALEGQTGWIALNQKVETPPPRVGDTIFGEITNETTKNGKPYRKFKKQNPKFAQSGGGAIPNDKLEYIVKMLEELTDRRPPHTADEKPQESQAPEYEDPFAGLGV